MKKQLSLYLIILFTSVTFLCPVYTKAQVVLTGTIIVETGEKFPYKIEFTETEGVIKGYSYTFSEPMQTKAVIKGSIDRIAHTLRFKETEILSSHIVPTKAFLCLVNAKLEYMHGAFGSELMGPITSADIDKASCTPGSLVFNNDEVLQKLFASQERFDTVVSMKKKATGKIIVASEDAPPSPPVVKTVPALVTDKVTAGIEKSYEWHTDTVILDVWDGGNIDGDRVTIQFNGLDVLTHHYLTKEKRRLRIPLPKSGINSLVIVADNEGSDPPNTATLLLTDGSKQYGIVAYNPKGQKSLIKIKKVN